MVAASVREWRSRGEVVRAGGHDLFVVDSGRGPAVLLLHGFPGSSHDWRIVMSALNDRGYRVVAFDLLGYGFSEKPFDSRYSLFEQADLAEAVAKVAGIDRCTIVSHDVGDTVAAELLMRSVEGKLSFSIERSIITNGSIFIDMAQLTAGQRALLSLPDEPLAESLPMEGFKPGLAQTFAQPPADDEIDAMIELIRHHDGDRLLPRIIRYIEERRANQERWTAGLVEFPGPMTAIWGALDPIAVVAMPHRLKELRPATEVVIWEKCGHWPSIEEPLALADAIAARIPR